MINRPLSRLTKLLQSVVLAVFILYLVIYVLYALSLFRFPYDYDQGEGFELNDSSLFSQGEWPYRSNEVFPFYASNYPPLFHLMVIPLFLIFGKTLLAGRVLAFAATLLIAWLVGRVVHDKTRDKWLASISGLMVLASNFIYHVGPLFRQHLMMVLFELLAVIFIARYDDPKHGRRNIFLSMFFLLCAGYTKQLSVATVIAVLVFLFLRAPKKSIAAGLWLAAVAGGIFLWINAATQGQWFLNTITANANVYDYQQAVDLYGQFFGLHFLIAALAIGYAVYELYWDRLSAYTVWFVFALANSALAGKWGAGESYFATAIVAACVLSGFAVGKIKEKFSLRNPKHLHRSADAVQVSAIAMALMIPLLYLLQAWGVRHLPTDGPIFGSIADLIGVGRNASVYAGYPYYDSIGYTQAGHQPTEADAQAGDRIVQIIRSSNQVALTEEALLALRADQPVVSNPTQLLNLWNNHALDPTDLIAMIDQQKFGVVVFRAQFYPPPMLQAVGARYQPIDDILMNGFVYHILAPRSDYGTGCDEARFYGLIAKLKALSPSSVTVKIRSRNTHPENWEGPDGVSEIVFQYNPKAETYYWANYSLWIAPLSWEGSTVGGGAEYLGRSNCFKFFGSSFDIKEVWPSAIDTITQALGIIR
jgi:hypothetical protein